MNVLVLNGSPRKNGNTRALLERFALAAEKKHTITFVDLQNLTISGCMGCDACRRNGGNCIQKDDAPALLEQVLAADCIIFGSPVYWWGVSAQMKSAIDRMYAAGDQLKGKKIGVLSVGAEQIGAPQYRIIKEQFQCIAEYLDWDLLFFESVSAAAAGEVKKHPELLERATHLADCL